MDALIQSFGQTLAQDVRELTHAPALQGPELVEIDPPQWHWHLPLGFASLAAAGALLVAAGGVHWEMQQQKLGARRAKTHMHKKKVKALPPRPE